MNGFQVAVKRFAVCFVLRNTEVTPMETGFETPDLSLVVFRRLVLRELARRRCADAVAEGNRKQPTR